jgi:lipoyl(octanoyl) transferase
MSQFTYKDSNKITSVVPILVSNIGRTRYEDAWVLQQKLWAFRQAGAIEDFLLLTEHEHVYTLGKSSDDNHLLASQAELKANGIDVFHIDRGGDITYHGPGQIVGYPILDLNKYFLDIHWYMRSLEEVIIRTLSKFGIAAGREKDLTGVWVNNEKIAAIGVKVSRWVTMHGFALNVNTDLTKYDRIIPCGIFHKGVTSMHQVLGQETNLGSVQNKLAESFAEVFTCQPQWMEKSELNTLAMRLSLQLLTGEGMSENLVTGGSRSGSSHS